MRTPGWHKAWLKIRHCFKMPLTLEKHAPPRLGAPLRYGPRHYMSAYAASLRSVAPGSIFFFYATRGSAASPLHRRAIVWRPSGALNSARYRSQTARQLPIYRAFPNHLKFKSPFYSLYHEKSILAFFLTYPLFYL